jgi:hypothetical protein
MRRVAALSLLLLAAGPAAADQLLARYAAWIAPADLLNSQGQPLTEPWQVLRQDRANFHRFDIRQFADEWDPIFGSADARVQFERLLQAGRIDPAARDAILRGNVRVRVEVWGQDGRPARAEVQVWP